MPSRVFSMAGMDGSLLKMTVAAHVPEKDLPASLKLGVHQVV